METGGEIPETAYKLLSNYPIVNNGNKAAWVAQRLLDLNLYSLGGNYQIQVDVTDNGEPGSSTSATPDTYALRVWDTSTGTYYQVGTASAQVGVAGGNIQVRP